jgi:hypothetical protein
MGGWGIVRSTSPTTLGNGDTGFPKMHSRQPSLTAVSARTAPRSLDLGGEGPALRIEKTPLPAPPGPPRQIPPIRRLHLQPVAVRCRTGLRVQRERIAVVFIERRRHVRECCRHLLAGIETRPLFPTGFGTSGLRCVGDVRGESVGRMAVERVTRSVVTPGRAGIGVSHEVLHVSEGNPGVESERRGCVPERVRGDALVDPARRARRRTIRVASNRSRRAPSLLSSRGPSLRPSVCASSAATVRGASAWRRTLPPLRVVMSTRWPRSVARSEIFAPQASLTLSPLSASRVTAPHHALSPQRPGEWLSTRLGRAPVFCESSETRGRRTRSQRLASMIPSSTRTRGQYVLCSRDRVPCAERFGSPEGPSGRD